MVRGKGRRIRSEMVAGIEWGFAALRCVVCGRLA